jgi:HEAT repeat protein
VDDTQLRFALSAPSSSDRLQSALTAGTYPDPDFVDALVERCAIEPDFYVRDMLTWALTRHPADVTVPRLVAEVAERDGQARSQALHSLSKIGDPAGWVAITPESLTSSDDEVARTAWRAAVILAPASEQAALATTLAAQLGGGGRDRQLSLSRALATLGPAADQALTDAAGHPDPDVRAHALATERQITDPDEGFDSAIYEAKRIVALGGSPA